MMTAGHWHSQWNIFPRKGKFCNSFVALESCGGNEIPTPWLRFWLIRYKRFFENSTSLFRVLWLLWVWGLCHPVEERVLLYGTDTLYGKWHSNTLRKVWHYHKLLLHKSPRILQMSTVFEIWLRPTRSPAPKQKRQYRNCT